MKHIVGIMAMLALTGAADVPQQAVAITVQGLRAEKGRLLVCLTRAPAHFPDCSKDPDKRHFTVPAGAGPISLGTVPAGTYAVAIIHDENGNGRLDTFAGIPREGVGFSRNPAIRFGAPSFRSAQFAVEGAPVRQDIRMKYFL